LKEDNIRLKNRDLSWLAFNHRVLQEAADPTVPLYERIKFLAIWSSNLDEFFRVRVASLRALQRLKKKTKRKLDIEPEKLLKRLRKAVWLQQEEFGDIFRNRIKKGLAKQGIFLVRETELDKNQRAVAWQCFQEKIQPLISPMVLGEAVPFLHNKALYLIARLRRKTAEKKESEEYALVEMSSTLTPRFVSLPSKANRTHILFLDDVIRLALTELFPQHQVIGSYAIKLTRDAELDIGDEFSGNLLEKVKKALKKRGEGVPSRFLYDGEMPKKCLQFLQKYFSLAADDLIPGSRYHNFSDFFLFPIPQHRDSHAAPLTYDPMPQFMPEGFEPHSVFERMRERDLLVHYPYHSYNCVINLLRGAADDPNVRSIKITLYRVARNSTVVEQLLRAARQGKEVTVFVEVKARFDEESNIFWAEELEKVGARVLYSIPNLKVHAKICLIERTEADEKKRHAYFSTGNFNENAAALYTDFGFFTSDDRLTREAERVFRILCREKKKGKFDHLLVAPFTMREQFSEMIGREMKHARKGRDAFMMAKMNSLEDEEMIGKLYEASQAGVKIHLIVRGICCLIPGVKGLSENIAVVSIVDRFLEHARVFVFHDDGDEKYFLSSADWMHRNLDRRIEVAFPIYDAAIQRDLRAILDLQLHDNVKARVVDRKLENRIRSRDNEAPLRSQYAASEFWKAAAAKSTS
jgi:polyphosphate kinase